MFICNNTGDWSDSSAHCNYSTLSMRQAGGISHIEVAIEKLRKEHDRHIALYDPKQVRNRGVKDVYYIHD